MKKKIFCFDLDNVICKTNLNNYKLSKPIKPVINLINKLYAKNYTIIIFTARYMGRSKEKVTIAKRKAYNLTKSQLKKWNCNYHKIIFGKPSYDYLVDDKAYGFKKKWYDDFFRRFKIDLL